METLALGLVLLTAILLSVDIAIAMLLASLALLAWDATVPLHLIAEKAVSQVALFPLLAVPGFIIAGELMNQIGMTRALGDLARALVGRWRGGMAHATVLACMFFGGMTGSGLAETVAIGSLMIPLLASHGFPKSFSAALVASGGSLGPIIPPSIPMVIYASIAPTVSISALFLAGVVPGLMIGIGFMLVVAWRMRTLSLATVDEPDSAPARVGSQLLAAAPALGVPVIIFYSIFSGIATVTEAAVLATAYVALVGLASRRLTLEVLLDAGRSTLIACGIFGFIIAAAGPFSFLMALFRTPEIVAQLLLSMSAGNSTVLMLMVTASLIALGTMVEATSLVIILAPILAAVAAAAGIDQLHMAVVSITALMLGLFTPPVGTNLFAVVGISGQRIEDISREIAPFALVASGIVLLLAVTPALTTLLPRLLLR